jgi:predicted RNase H-like nuclease (RuvC/YqgF family)
MTVQQRRSIDANTFEWVPIPRFKNLQQARDVLAKRAIDRQNEELNRSNSKLNRNIEDLKNTVETMKREQQFREINRQSEELNRRIGRP